MRGKTEMREMEREMREKKKKGESVGGRERTDVVDR